MAPRLRPARVTDSEFVFSVKKDALGPYIEAVWGWDETFQLDFHAKDFDLNTVTIIAEGNIEVGWFEVDRTGDEIQLPALYILSEHQGRGIGTAVLEGLMREARKQRRSISLQVLKANPRARALYERLGFAVTGESSTHHRMRYTPAS